MSLRREGPITRVVTHPRSLWWVTFDAGTQLYSLVDAWKGEVAASDDLASIDAAARLLASWEPIYG